ncbi:hypothetical protein F5876DRAFT_70520 [Lentinula aff. lateritia]|uniref:Uncharacterized protein n=1 Tax=Lentinula aff. lateritia TaxID=2804960 RepID=A0ACC1TIP8_9AGAR|nr:hypothetical protein F5876DRAFT_70520 [Lentinula aff. lateritia]
MSGVEYIGKPWIYVYNISLPLALLLSVPGFLIYAQWEMYWVSEFESSLRIPSLPSISYTLTLSSLSLFGPGLKIAHRASLVHPNHLSQCPDIGMVEEVLKSKTKMEMKTETQSGRAGGEGLILEDLARLRLSRERESQSDLESKKCRLDRVHKQVALGEKSVNFKAVVFTLIIIITTVYPSLLLDAMVWQRTCPGRMDSTSKHDWVA